MKMPLNISGVLNESGANPKALNICLSVQNGRVILSPIITRHAGVELDLGRGVDMQISLNSSRQAVLNLREVGLGPHTGADSTEGFLPVDTANECLDGKVGGTSFPENYFFIGVDDVRGITQCRSAADRNLGADMGRINPRDPDSAFHSIRLNYDSGNTRLVVSSNTGAWIQLNPNSLDLKTTGILNWGCSFERDQCGVVIPGAQVKPPIPPHDDQKA